MTSNYIIDYFELGKPHYLLHGTSIDVTEAIRGIIAKLPEMRECFDGDKANVDTEKKTSQEPLSERPETETK